MLNKVAENISIYNLDNKNILRKVMIGLEKIDIQKGIMVEALLDSRAIVLETNQPLNQLC